MAGNGRSSLTNGKGGTNMKTVFTYLVLSGLSLVAVLPAAAQRLTFNERAPQLQITEYLFGEAPESGRTTYVEFFVPGTRTDDGYFETLETFAVRYKDRINFIVLAKGDKEAVKKFFADKKPSYRVAYDEQGKTFTDFNIQYLPTSVIIDSKGRFVWQGKATQLEDRLMERY